MGPGRPAPSEPYPFETTERGIACHVRPAPCGSLLLFLSAERTRRPRRPRGASSLRFRLPRPPAVRRIEPNVLVLDYVDVTRRRRDAQEDVLLPGRQFAFAEERHGAQPVGQRRAVQGRADLARSFRPRAASRRPIASRSKRRVPARSAIVVERPDLYTITCNGAAGGPATGEWWLDRAFGRIDIAERGAHRRERADAQGVALDDLPRARAGLRARRFRRGGRRPRLRDRSRPGIDPRARGTRRAIRSTARASHTPRRSSFRTTRGEYRVQLRRWYGSVARVRVNGQAARLHPVGSLVRRRHAVDYGRREHHRGDGRRHAQEHARAAPRRCAPR